ncbi:MAG: iron ABC transporter permease, partial [Gemmatimonadota bacterium]
MAVTNASRARAPRGFWGRLRSQLRPQLRLGFTPWTIATLVVVALVTIPLLSIAVGVMGEASDTWRHLARTVLPTYVVNSAILMVGVGALTLLMGISTAWLTTTCDFPGRRTFQWALILPLAIPTYIIAFTYAGIFDYTGPVQQLVGSFWPGAAAAARTRVMSMGGVIVMMALVLYPYVYLIARASFLKQSGGVLETSRILGRTPWQTFFRVALPMARPAIVAGVTLVLMEVLNEYGAVKYLGVPTFTTGIFRAWFALGDANAAMRLSGCLLLFVFLLIVLERAQRGRARFQDRPSGYRPVSRFQLTRGQGIAALATCTVPVALGFGIPVLQLLAWSASTASNFLDRAFLLLALNSFGLAVLAAGLAVLVALLIVYSARLSPTPLLKLASRISVLGYSIPGAVIAVGVLLPFVWLDTRVDLFMRATFGVSTGLLLSGTLVALTFAYVVRFLAVALNPVDAGFSRVCGTLDE